MKLTTSLLTQEKRNDRETVRLQKSLEYAKELSDILIPASVELLEGNTPELKAKGTISEHWPNIQYQTQALLPA